MSAKVWRVAVFDIGGTFSRHALYTSSPETMSTLTVAESQIVRGLYDGLDLSGFINWIGEVATEWYPDVDAISVGFPGPVRADGFVYRAPTLLGSDFMGGWWPPMLCTSGRSIPYVIMNDVSAAAKGVLGDGTETNSAVINMGSGLGVKVFVKGQERSGPNGRGGELGHWRVTNDDRFVCDCGGRGHLGAVASGRGAEQLALLMGYPSSAENIAAEFVAGKIGQRSLLIGFVVTLPGVYLQSGVRSVLKISFL